MESESTGTAPSGTTANFAASAGAALTNEFVDYPKRVCVVICDMGQKPLDTARAGGPFGLALGLPFRMGVPNTGGSISTGSGLVFIAATQDRFFRAFDITNGKELWRSSLPAAGMATPMTYLTPRTGRQMVVIAAGGHDAFGGRTGDSLVAFVLSDKAQRRSGGQ